jgi:hypothetical protein
MRITLGIKSATNALPSNRLANQSSSDFGFRPVALRQEFGLRISAFGIRITRAFTLIEVMIACGIFFMATFAILALVSTTLRNARALQRDDVDAGMAAAQVYQTLRTNRLTEVNGSGNFGDAYPDFSYEFATQQYASNGLLQVDIVVNRRGLRKPVDALTIWVYNPDAKSQIGGGPMFR